MPFFLLFIRRPISYALCIVAFFMPLYPILFDRFWSGTNEAFFWFYLTYLAYKLPLDALFGLTVGLAAILPLQKLWPKVESKQWSEPLAFVLLFSISALGAYTTRQLVGAWLQPESFLPTGEPLRQYKWLSNQFNPVFASIYLTLGWQRARLPKSIQDKIGFGEAKSKLAKRQINFYKEVFANSHRRVFDSHATLNDAILKSESIRLHEDFAEADDYTQNMATSHAGHLYLRRYELDGVDADLDQAIGIWQEVLKSSPSKPYQLASSLTDLSAGLLARYDRDGNLAYLDDAIRHLRESLDLLPDDAALFRIERPLLGMALSMRAIATQNAAKSDEAVTLARTSLTAAKLTITTTRLDDELRQQLKVLIAAVLINAYELRKNADDLTLAIQLLQPIVSELGRSNERRAHAEEFLGHCLLERYLESRSPYDLRSAIKLTTSALELTAEKDGRLARRLNLVGKCWQAQHLRLGSANDLDNAITHLQRAVEIARLTSPYRPRYEQNLQAALASR